MTFCIPTHLSFGYSHYISKKCIIEEMKVRMVELANEQFGQWGCEILEMNGEENHMHLLFEAPPQVQLSKLINSFKTVTSRIIRKEFEER